MTAGSLSILEPMQQMSLLMGSRGSDVDRRRGRVALLIRFLLWSPDGHAALKGTDVALPLIVRSKFTFASGGPMSRLPLLGLLLLVTVTLSGCDLVGDVLEFGFWVMLIVIVLVVALVVWLIKKVF